MKHPAVFIIGAGPGDPRLITVYGRECLHAADVIVYDRLVPPRVLAYARSGAELIDVGTPGPQALAHEAVNYLVAEKAREGKLVARVKWGDPFLFDTGGEEALFLHENGVPYEIVPGIAAGLAIPAYAGVPITYPRGGDVVTLVRGGEGDNRDMPDVDWRTLARLDGTVVCHAGAQQVPRLLEALAAADWPDDTPALLVYNGTLSTQASIGNTLRDIRENLHAHPRRQGGTLVLGRVVAFREHLRWFDARPLFGRRILVTRPRDQAAELTDRLVALGAEAIESPMIRIAPPEDAGPLRRAAAQPHFFDWIVFASANAVDAFMAALLDGQRDVRALQGPGLCAVGTGTAERLAHYGIRVDLVPAEFRGEGLAAALAAGRNLDGARVLLPRADIAREVIAEQLRAAGAIVTDVIAYRTVLEDAPPEGAPDIYRLLLEGRIDVVTFTSASAVRNFAKVYGREQAVDLLKNTRVATIGPVTAEAAAQLGIEVSIQPATYTVPALVEAIAAHYAMPLRT